MKKNLLLSFIFLAIISASPVSAKTATPSAQITATPSAQVSPTEDQVKANLTDRINNIIQEKLSSSEAKIKEKLTELALVGYVGKVTQVTATNLTINADDEIFQVATTDTTVLVNGAQKIKLSSIAIGDKIIVIGSMNAKKDLITAKRVVVIKATTPAAKPVFYFGTIQKLDTKKRTIILKTTTDSLTLILSKKATPKIEEMIVGKNVFVITRVQDSGTIITEAKIL